jgi:CubicO group peptidase (beta-lactamase class C family)
MGNIDVEVDPAEVGFDIDRLGRIDRHFADYVDDGRLPGWLTVVARHGKVVHVGAYGMRDVEAGLPIEADTIFRIYSMSKPITSVAAMMLYEEGGFELKDEVSRFIPSFADTLVYHSGSYVNPITEPMVEPMRIWHLLTHTSGLSYGFHYSHPVDAIYRAAGFEWGVPRDLDLAACCDRFAELPLVFQPGSSWNYSVSTDVLGRIVEVVSGQSLDAFFNERIFEPLGMTDTAFFVDDDDHGRLAALYVPEPGTLKAIATPMGREAARRPTYLSGGGGLVSTAHDYHRFAQMLLGGGELDGTRLLSPRTVAYMTRNHLPGGADLEAFGQSSFSETTFDGVGFGLGFSVVEDSVANKVLSSVGDYGWGGAASTAFWVDPAEDITVLFLTQLLPSSTHPIRPQLKQLVYQALVD